MMRKMIVGLTAVAVMGVMAGCDSTPEPKKPAAGFLPDSQVVEDADLDAPRRRPGDTLVIGEKDKVPFGSDDFYNQNKRLVEEVFVDYKKVEMDPMDAYPNFKTARKSNFVRLRRRMPTSAPAGPSVYPQVLVKSFTFDSEDALKGELTAHLNGMEHSGPAFQLGQDVKAVKSPPLLIFYTEKYLAITQWSCQYRNESWDSISSAYFSFAENAAALGAFELSCKAGELVYHIRPKN